MNLKRLFFCALFVLLAMGAASAYEEPISLVEKEQMLLRAIAKGDNETAWRIAGSGGFWAIKNGVRYAVRGLNINLAYRGRDGQGETLITRLRLNAKLGIYKKMERFHADLSRPDRIVYALRPIVPTAQTLVPGTPSNYKMVSDGQETFFLVEGKIYADRMGMSSGVPQLLWIFSPEATKRYATNQLSWEVVGSSSLNS